MANPTPEIMPEIAAPYVRVMATGRSDYPNQINNVLAFPGIFKGALACRATQISEGMKVAAAEAIAACISDDELNEDYIIPSVFNRNVAPTRGGEGDRGRPGRGPRPPGPARMGEDPHDVPARIGRTDERRRRAPARPDHGLGARAPAPLRRHRRRDGHEWRGVPTLLLTTRGRRSGNLRRTPLIYGRSGDGLRGRRLGTAASRSTRTGSSTWRRAGGRDPGGPTSHARPRARRPRARSGSASGAR